MKNQLVADKNLKKRDTERNLYVSLCFNFYSTVKLIIIIFAKVYSYSFNQVIKL